mgnify:CR=1 FL=1
MDTSDTSLHVACLCAAWCRLCDGYRPVLEQVEAELRAAGAAPRWHWVDIEDDADLVGELDVETFPTIVVCDADQVRFAGPVTPQPETLRRLLRALGTTEDVRPVRLQIATRDAAAAGGGAIERPEQAMAMAFFSGSFLIGICAAMPPIAWMLRRWHVLTRSSA